MILVVFSKRGRDFLDVAILRALLRHFDLQPSAATPRAGGKETWVRVPGAEDSEVQYACDLYLEPHNFRYMFRR